MGAIVDILHAGEDAIDVIRAKYPHATIMRVTDTGRLMEKYRVIIPGEQEESYYFFLCDNCLATCSRNFLNRVIDDGMFRRIVKLRIAKSLEALNQQAEALDEVGVAARWEPGIDGDSSS